MVSNLVSKDVDSLFQNPASPPRSLATGTKVEPDSGQLTEGFLPLYHCVVSFGAKRQKTMLVWPCVDL